MENDVRIFDLRLWKGRPGANESRAPYVLNGNAEIRNRFCDRERSAAKAATDAPL